jgi:hypothetical protein
MLPPTSLNLVEALLPSKVMGPTKGDCSKSISTCGGSKRRLVGQ